MYPFLVLDILSESSAIAFNWIAFTFPIPWNFIKSSSEKSYKFSKFPLLSFNNECAISNGFGLQGGKAASQDVALVLSATGDISISTAKEIINGVRKRNDICHNQNEVELTQFEANNFSKIAKEAMSIIEKHKSEGVITRL